MKRLEKKIWKKKSRKAVVLSEDEIIMDTSYYLHFFKGNFALAITQSLGHRDYTDILPEIFETSFTNEDRIRIVAGSDGYFDMHCESNESDMNDLKNLSSAELVDKAEYRWKKEWKYCTNKDNLEKFVLTKFPSYDDVSILLIEKGNPCSL
jgi:serine/threonine protein phosphatase PrpC